MKLMRLRSKKFSRSNSNNNKLENGGGNSNNNAFGGGEIKWELRPGGMLVQKRECGDGSTDGGEGLITLRVSTVSKCHDISIQSTSTFGNLLLYFELDLLFHLVYITVCFLINFLMKFYVIVN